MKQITRLIIISLTIAALAGCSMMNEVRGSGTAVVKSYNYTDFTGISINETCDLTVTQGDTFSVIITTDDNVADYLAVSEADDTLSIGLKSGYSYSNIIFEAVVTMPELNKLSANGASEANVTGFSSSKTLNINADGASEVNMNYESTSAINASLSGASELNLTTQNISGDVDFNCEGASNLKFTATSGSSDADISCEGASKIDIRNFTAKNAVVNISGASNAWVKLTGTLSGSVEGASELRYSGGTLGNLDVEFASNASIF